MFPVSTNLIGMSLGFPDVCKMPTPAGPVPVPLPNISMTTTCNPSTASANVLCRGGLTMTMKSETLLSNGDEAGTLGGMVSNRIMGATRYTTASFTIFTNSMPTARWLGTTMQNAMPPNAVGAQLVPSQIFVINAC